MTKKLWNNFLVCLLTSYLFINSASASPQAACIAEIRAKVERKNTYGQQTEILLGVSAIGGPYKSSHYGQNEYYLFMVTIDGLRNNMRTGNMKSPYAECVYDQRSGKVLGIEPRRN